MSTAFPKDSELQSLIVYPREMFWPERESCPYFQKPSKRFFLSSWQQEAPNFWFQFPQRRKKKGKAEAFLIPHVTSHTHSTSKSSKYNMLYEEDALGPASQMGELRLRSQNPG